MYKSQVAKMWCQACETRWRKKRIKKKMWCQACETRWRKKRIKKYKVRPFGHWLYKFNSSFYTCALYSFHITSESRNSLPVVIFNILEIIYGLSHQRHIPNKLRAFPHLEFVDCSHHIGQIKHKWTMLTYPTSSCQPNFSLF